MARELITIEQARQIVFGAVRPLAGETVPVADALGRVLAAEVRAAGDVPPFPCSAMDGYAIRPGAAGRAFRVVAESRAGTPADRSVTAGEAIRISTGAPLPDGADAVARQEDVEEDDDRISVAIAVTAGANVRRAGEHPPSKRDTSGPKPFFFGGGGNAGGGAGGRGGAGGGKR